MSLPNTPFYSQPSGTHSANPELTDDNILVAVASQFSKLLQAHKLSMAQTDIAPEDVARVDTVKQAAIAKIILLLTAYYRTQGWNPQDIKTSVLNMLDQPQS
ncbi:MAG: hypothetical protein HY785_09625 [Oscillatoriophycideae cyanobacterium NC_groundwater_1537_Pr4_S-0.65um_50_18]|nr:hypothetical protein [Oscillatoriophycideae cyanobacterium NC_groundwater_1537_Pr4_S-0.65um_50_18]